MKRIALISGLAAAVTLATAPVSHARQDAAPSEQPSNLTLPLVAGVTAAPDCGGLYGLAGNAHCMATELPRLPAVAELYMTALPQAGWPHVGGGDNQVVFQRNRDDGLCDFLVMVAFYDTAIPEEDLASATGYLGFVMRTEGACMDVPAEGETPAE